MGTADWCSAGAASITARLLSDDGPSDPSQAGESVRPAQALKAGSGLPFPAFCEDAFHRNIFRVGLSKFRFRVARGHRQGPIVRG
jgi:hypothetical protein